MAAPYIDANFEIKFARDVHLEFMQRGSKLRNFVRTDGEVRGETIRFPKFGTLSMVSKARNGEIPVTNPAHNYATATMIDKYLRVQIDKLDLSKMSLDVRSGYITQMVSAAAEATDDQILDAIDAGATVTIGDYGSSDTDYIDENMALEIGEALDLRKVPRDGKRFCIVTPRQWAALKKIDSFASSDYVGADLPFKKVGFEMVTWNDMNWCMHYLLPGVGTATARCFAFHQSCVGHGISSEFEMMWAPSVAIHGWEGSGGMSMGATVIDANGVVEVRVDDTGALPV